MLRLTPLVLVLSLAGVPATAGTAADVAVEDNEFNPEVVRVAVGGAVHWKSAPSSVNQHNVSSDDGLFRSGAPEIGTIEYNVTFSAGTFSYRCEIHGGMSGRVRVPVVISAAPAGKPFTVTWATSDSETGDRWDVEFRVGTGAWKTWRNDTTKLAGVFGKDGKPVTVKRGVVYRFRARSIGSGDASGFSPARRFSI
jgi:plastocyanin